jgi:hypothetical protein
MAGLGISTWDPINPGLKLGRVKEKKEKKKHD